MRAKIGKLSACNNSLLAFHILGGTLCCTAGLLCLRDRLVASRRARVQRGPSQAARCASTGGPSHSLLFPLHAEGEQGLWRDTHVCSNCARRTRPVLGRAFREQGATWVSCQSSALASPSSTPVQYVFPVTPWLSDSFSSFRDSAQVRRRTSLNPMLDGLPMRC